MNKKTSYFDDEIDLIKLIEIIIAHNSKFFILGMGGLILGLVFTYQHEPYFETEFKVHVGHPAFTHQSLIYSSGVQEKLNASNLNPHRLPHYKLNKKTEIFSVISETSNSAEVVTQMITEAMQHELMQLKEVATSFEGFDNKPVILNNNNDNNNNNLTWTNKDIAKLNPDQVIESLKISFSQPKALSPRPFKYGAIGLFIGLMAAFLWMLTVIISRQLKARH